MKKTFKRAGVAVLSMAMLLSMGAVGAMSANAAGESITVRATQTGLKAGDKVNVYKVAQQDASNKWEWTTSAYDTAAGADFDAISSYDAANTKALAAKLARVASNPDASGEVDTAIDLAKKGDTAIDLAKKGAGYYLVTAAPKDAGKVAQPMLIQVDGAEEIKETKVSDIPLTKKITKVMEGTNDKTSSNVQDTGKNAQVKAGDVVTYRIVTLVPTYDTAAKNIQNFVLTDKSDNTLTSCGKEGFKVITADDKDATTGADVKKFLKRTDGQNFNVTIPGDNVKTYSGKYLIVEFTATVSETPKLSKGLGARETVEDYGTKGADANRNDVTLTYGNNYSTGGGSDTDGDGDVDDKDDQPELKDYADVYATALFINKTLDKVAANANDKKVGFELWQGETQIGDEQFTDENGKVSFIGLDAGKYTLMETKTVSGYKKVANFDVEISSDTPYAVFTASSGWDNETNGGFKKDIDNPPTEALPGTGGMGTVLFTVGGAAIVLLAGALFVVYMRKRKADEE